MANPLSKEPNSYKELVGWASALFLPIGIEAHHLEERAGNLGSVSDLDHSTQAYPKLGSLSAMANASAKSHTATLSPNP